MLGPRSAWELPRSRGAARSAAADSCRAARGAAIEDRLAALDSRAGAVAGAGCGRRQHRGFVNRPRAGLRHHHAARRRRGRRTGALARALAAAGALLTRRQSRRQRPPHAASPRNLRCCIRSGDFDRRSGGRGGSGVAAAGAGTSGAATVALVCGFTMRRAFLRDCLCAGPRAA